MTTDASSVRDCVIEKNAKFWVEAAN